MSGDKSSAVGQGVSSSNDDVQPSTGGGIPEKNTVTQEEQSTKEKSDDTQNPAPSFGSSLLGAFLSPFSSVLRSAPDQTKTPDSNSNQGSIQKEQSPITSQETNEQPTLNCQGNTDTENPTIGNENTTNPVQVATKPEEKAAPPEAYYTPNEVPLFKKLQKKRLTGTRTKQLLRAGSRAHDDPPPPPELGTCCGSSCDPCVNDLWREERDIWRERWGDRAAEKGEGKRKELEW